MLFAPTGRGKTLMGMALGMRMSAGTDFLGWHGRRPCTTLYIDGEMSRPLFQQRLRDEVKRLGQMPEGFHALSHEDLGLHWHPLNTPEGQGMIEKVLSEIGNVDFVLFDNIMSLIEGDPKDTEAWGKTLRWINLLTGRCIGQLWVHHANEGGRMYGDKTRAWRMDTVAVMEPMSHPNTDVSFLLTFDAEKGGKARGRTPQNRADFATKHVTLIDDKWSYRVDKEKRPKVKPDSVAAQYLLALKEALAAAAGCNVAEDAPPGATVTRNAWMAVCVRRGLLDDPNEKPDAYRFQPFKVHEGPCGRRRDRGGRRAGAAQIAKQKNLFRGPLRNKFFAPVRNKRNNFGLDRSFVCFAPGIDDLATGRNKRNKSETTQESPTETTETRA
jgi:AAA domain